MGDFEKYLKKLADHEEKKAKVAFKSPREKILVYSGIHLNWLGDFFGNPNIKWEKRKIAVDKIEFGGIAPKWDNVLLRKCERSPAKLRELVEKDESTKKLFEKEFLKRKKRKDIILVRVRKDSGKYIVLDGMHRFVRLVLEGKREVEVYLPINEKEELPYCEPHVVYDLIRGFRRNADDEEGERGLYQSLLFLTRIYGNVKDLLRTRFSRRWVHSEKASDVIEKLLKE